MSTLNARANQAYRDLEAKLEQDECVPNFVSEQDAWEDGWETGYKTAASEAESNLNGEGSVQVGAHSPEPLRVALEKLATQWADQPTDYDEDTEQQIEDGRALRSLLAAHPVEPARGELYFCPVGGEVEQRPGGGFDVCCDAPDRHIPLEPDMIDQAVSCWLGLSSRMPAEPVGVSDHLQPQPVASRDQIAEVLREHDGYGCGCCASYDFDKHEDRAEAMADAVLNLLGSKPE